MYLYLLKSHRDLKNIQEIEYFIFISLRYAYYQLINKH